MSDPIIRHGKCGKTWTGVTRCHCGNCHETFSGLAAFEEHQKGFKPGSPCKYPALSGLVPREQAWGTLWGFQSPGTAHPRWGDHG